MFLGYFFAFLKNIIYGSSIYFTSSLTKTTDVLDILSLRFLMSFITLWLLKVTGILKINVGLSNIVKSSEKSKHIKTLLLAALFEPVLYMLFETLGISMTTGITTAVILSLQPVVACVGEELLLKEKSSALEKIFLCLGIFGVIYISAMTDTGNGENSVMGIIFVFLAVISGGGFLLFSRKSSKHFNAFEITYTSCMLGAFAFNLVNIFRHLFAGSIINYFDPYFSLDNLIGFIFLAIISTIAATAMNNFALSKIQASTMSAFGGVSTLVTILIGVIFNNEHLEHFHLIGLSLILARMIGVSYIAIRREKRQGKNVI